jgi:acyl carrier protein
MEALVRSTVGESARLQRSVTELGIDDDLYAAGLTSHASVTLMLALEDAFDVEFPERLLRKSTFASLGSIVAALTELDPAAVA